MLALTTAGFNFRVSFPPFQAHTAWCPQPEMGGRSPGVHLTLVISISQCGHILVSTKTFPFHFASWGHS